MNIKEIKKYIEEAEFILIGCGKELSDDRQDSLEIDIFKPIEEYGIYNKEDLMNYVQNEKYATWLRNILVSHYNKEFPKEKNIYQKLYYLIRNKDYFIITTNTDQKIYQSDIDVKRIVSPCGNEKLFQCKDNCTQEVWNNDEYMVGIFKNLGMVLHAIKEKNMELVEKYIPKCKNCKKEAIFNIRKDKLKYNENGYIEQWKKYMEWIQKTINRKIVIIELGEDFRNPTVIRWPFEKIVYINDKATFFRVNESFPQISEEIKNKAFALTINSSVFLEHYDEESCMF